MRVIFLDFDGVITTLKSRWKLDADKMLLLKRIVDDTGAKIVISSSWRRFTLEDTIKTITDTVGNYYVGGNPFLCPESVIGITERMYSFCYGNEDKHFILPRGVEIKHYLEEHPDIENYVILDDDSDMLLEQIDNFVQTDGIEGLTDDDVERAIEILKNGKDKDIRV